jgi:hypothetical protein
MANGVNMKLTRWKPLRKLVNACATIKYYRLLHGFKTAIACLIGLALEKYFKWPMGQWVPITIIVVMSAQLHFGAALKKAYMRFLGTIAGLTTTVVTLLLFGNNMTVVFIVVFCSCLIFTYIAGSHGDINYAGTLGGVTVVLTLTGADANVNMAIMRGSYIVLGIVIAILVSRFVFPLHAREKLRYSVAATLRNLRQLYFKAIQVEPGRAEAVAAAAVVAASASSSSVSSTVSKVGAAMVGDAAGSSESADERRGGDNERQQRLLDTKLEKAIVCSLDTQPKLIEEAAIGSRRFSIYKKNLFIEIVAAERRIYRLVYFMYRSLYEDADISRVIHKINCLEKLHLLIEASLDKMAESLERLVPLQLDFDVKKILKEIAAVANELPEKQAAQKMLNEHSFLFFMEQLVKELQVLGELLNKIDAETTLGAGRMVAELV